MAKKNQHAAFVCVLKLYNLGPSWLCEFFYFEIGRRPHPIDGIGIKNEGLYSTGPEYASATAINAPFN
jgi:hypothetical protein